MFMVCYSLFLRKKMNCRLLFVNMLSYEPSARLDGSTALLCRYKVAFYRTGHTVVIYFFLKISQ